MSEYREYKKWLKDTLPKLEEWAESDEDDAGDCPLVQDEASWILGLIKDTEAERDRLKAELEKYKGAANKSVCTYCGYVGPKDVETMLKHMVVCEKHPTMKMIEKANELLQDRDRYRSLAEKMREALEEIRRNSGAGDDDCGAWGIATKACEEFDAKGDDHV